MAVRRWTGVVSGDLNVAGNWDDGAGGGGAVPVNDDDVYFTYGSVDVDTNPDALDGVTLDSFTVSPGYTGNIADDTNKMEIDPDNILIEGAEDSSHYFDVVVTGEVTVKDTGTMVKLIGTAPVLNLLGGNVTIGTTTNSIVRVGSDCTLIIVSATLTNAVVYNNGGKVTCDTTVPDLYNIEGDWEQTDGNFTNYCFIFDGLVEFSSNGGTSGPMYVYGGKLDFSGDPGSKVINTILLSENGFVDLDNKSNNLIVITNGMQFLDGVVHFAPNTKIVIAEWV